LHADGVTKRYRDVTALSDFSLELGADDARIVALAGRSGAGKTTALQIALGFLAATSGTIRYRGTALRMLRRRQRKGFRREVQAVLQDPFAAFNPFYRVRHVFDVAARNFEIPNSTHAIGEAIEFVALDPARVLAAFPHELSGGERQRAMIARALLLRPRLIIADEPLSMVDASTRSAILEVVLRLRKEVGISFLYATHDLSTAYHVADELIVLHEGETVERGPARDVIDAPQHPYTREMIDAVPVPDPEIRWRGGP
jgi:peptide/nickel transport system ATP-binding protein